MFWFSRKICFHTFFVDTCAAIMKNRWNLYFLDLCFIARFHQLCFEKESKYLINFLLVFLGFDLYQELKQWEQILFPTSSLSLASSWILWRLLRICRRRPRRRSSSYLPSRRKRPKWILMMQSRLLWYTLNSPLKYIHPSHAFRQFENPDYQCT